jgi:4-amino-4-deoxy-L-arabinose transferase-like glycosyltransferase
MKFGGVAYAVALAAIALFLATGLRHLDAVPQVYEDEPWQASTGYKLMTSGVFGSDLFAGFYHMDQRYYGFMPLHPLLLAATFKALGVGLAQARAETVLLTALTLLLTFALGVRLFSPAVGAVAVALLVLVRWTGLTYVQLSGIPMVDLARIARYDPLVPVIGLGALHVYLFARARRANRWLYLAAGALAGLAGLAHVYGLFWVPALVILAVWDGSKRGAAWLVLGSALPWLPYAAYVLADVVDWRGQTAIYASRFELLNPRWYADNIAQEYHRYGPGLGSFGLGWLARPGFWFLLVALPWSLAALARRAWLAADGSARALIVPALLFPALFAMFITLKLVNYTLIELPLFALAIGWGLVGAWSWPAPAWGTALRAGLVVLSMAVLVEGAVALGHLEQAATTATAYPALIADLRQYLPAGARVLGLHSYWLGLQDFDYRSFLVPLNWADEGLPLDQGLVRVAPDVVLLDSRMRDYFNSPEVSADRGRFYGWLGAHGARLIGRIDDPTYGLVEVYRVEP